MSSDPVDEFTRMMEEAGFEVKETTDASQEEVVVEYTGASMSFPNADGYPVTVDVRFPVGQAMDGARALVLAATADYIKVFLAGALTTDDDSVHGYMDANGIHPEKYVEDAFTEADAKGTPDLDEVNGFFDLDN